MEPGSVSKSKINIVKIKRLYIITVTACHVGFKCTERTRTDVRVGEGRREKEGLFSLGTPQ